MTQQDTTPSRGIDARAVFGLLGGGYLLLILYPILRANRFHCDDMARILRGDFGWLDNGRPLAALIMSAMQMQPSALVDVAPLPQLLAIAVLSWTGVLLARYLDVRPPWMAALLAWPLGAQPFFLENLSYRFDAPCMALAVLLALWPIIGAPSSRRDGWLGVASLVACLCAYQPAINAFLIFAWMELALGQARMAAPMTLLTTLGKRAAQGLLAVVIYQLTAGRLIQGWVASKSSVIHGWDERWIVFDNARRLFAYFVDALPAHGSGWLLLVLALTLAAPYWIGWRYALRQRPWWFAALLLIAGCLLPLVMIVSVAGPLLLSTNMLVVPRVFIGAGALLSALLIFLHAGLREIGQSTRLSGVLAGLWALGMVVFAQIYGNALADQKRYEAQIAFQLADDLADAGSRFRLRAFLFDGSAGLSPVARHTAEQFPLIRQLVLPYLQQNDFNSMLFARLYIDELRDVWEDPRPETAPLAADILAEACDSTVVYVRYRYALRIVGDTAVVTFPGGAPASCGAAATAVAP